MGIGRRPDFLAELDLYKKLWDIKVDGSSDILKQQRLIILWAPQTTPPPGMISGWMPYEFPYPALIQPLSPLNPAPGTAQSGKIFAFYGEPSTAQNDVPFFARQSHNGMLWIPFPGKWYLVYDGTVDTRIQAIVHDDTCGAAQDLLPKRGIIIADSEVNVLTAAATTIIADNAFRDGIVIQNQGGVDCWVRRGTAGGATPAAVGTGLIVPPRESLELIGDLAWKGALNGRMDGANGDVMVWEILS